MGSPDKHFSYCSLWLVSFCNLPANCELHALLFFALFTLDLVLWLVAIGIYWKEHKLFSHLNRLCVFMTDYPVTGRVTQPDPCAEVLLYDFVQPFSKITCLLIDNSHYHQGHSLKVCNSLVFNIVTQLHAYPANSKSLSSSQKKTPAL